MESMGVVVNIDYLILLIPTLLVYICSFLQQHAYFFKCFFVLVPDFFGNKILCNK